MCGVCVSVMPIVLLYIVFFLYLSILINAMLLHVPATCHFYATTINSFDKHSTLPSIMAEDKSMVNGDNINHEPSKKVTPKDENNCLSDNMTKTVEEPHDDPGPSVTNSNLEDDSDTSSDESDTDSEDDKPKAPIELLGEFLLYIRKGNWIDAKKLCQMILLYEPENPEALQFRGVIDEKIQVEKELAEEESADEDSDNPSSECDEATTDDDDNNDGKASSSESEDEDTSDEDDNKHEHLRNKLIFPRKDDDDKTLPKT